MNDLHDVYNMINNDEDINFGKLDIDPDLNLYSIAFDIKFGSNAVTLNTTALSSDKWEVTGKVKEDYYEWINDFYAVEKSTNNVVFGNFEDIVYATDKDTYDRFRKQIKVDDWDYMDI